MKRDLIIVSVHGCASGTVVEGSGIPAKSLDSGHQHATTVDGFNPKTCSDDREHVACIGSNARHHWLISVLLDMSGSRGTLWSCRFSIAPAPFLSCRRLMMGEWDGATRSLMSWNPRSEAMCP